jgi:acetylornithine deacetylase
MGFSVETYAAEPHRPNVVGTLAGAADGPSLILNDHLDTYPVMAPERWKMTEGSPFNATRHGDELYARGTSDTRGNLACTLLAVEALRAAGVDLDGTLHCIYTVDEEKNGPKGSMYLLNDIGITADYEITAEPTAWGDPTDEWGMALSVANSGNCLVEIAVEGVKSHIWRPDTGANAIAKMAEIIPHIVAMPFTHEPASLMGHTPPCAAIVRVRGGLSGEMQFTPDVCTLTLAVVGVLPGMTMASVLADIEAEIGRKVDMGNQFSVAVRQVPRSLFVNGTEPIPVDTEPCVSLRSVYRRMMGTEPVVNRKNAFNDTIRFNEAGIAAVTFGPGEDGWSPDDEAIWISKAVMATRIYALTVMEILGVRA